MKRYIAFVAMMVTTVALMAQKPKQTTEFGAANLPDGLQEWMAKSTSDSDRQREAAKTVKAFRASYGAMDDGMQERVTAVVNYGVAAKLKGGTEMVQLVRTLTAYATAPGGGQNLDGWLKTLEGMKRRAAKGKAVIEWVDFSERLLKERVLYRSQTSEWRLDAKAAFRIGVEGGETRVWVDSPSDLFYSSAKDDGVIHGTTGSYDYKEGLWRGDGGRIDWSRTGLGAEACYAELRRYKAETKFPKFTADSALLVNTHYFSEPVTGRVEEALSVPMEPGKYSYPRFRSYKRDFVIRDIMPDVDYSGSFMMNGAKFITASSKHPASLIFRRGGKRQLSVTALKFTITPERMVSENAAVAFYVGEADSIANTGINVRYTTADRKVTMVNDPKRNFYSPYTDSYHELDIYSDLITWVTTGDVLEFSNLGATSGTATFESSNYYTLRKAREIQGIDEVSPVKRVYDYFGGYNYSFPVREFSTHIGLDMGQTMLMIHGLTKHGLVSYNEMTGMVMVKEKLEDYMKALSRTKGADYDALSIESNAKNYNARMNIDDHLIEMRGVQQFVVSDSQRVVVYPRGGKITMGENRSIHFNGRIDAGRFTMFVTDCDFSYEQFGFEMPKVDSLFFYVPEFNNPDTDHMVMTPLYGLVGRLTVDQPDNHCGLKKNKEYPIFESREKSFVYYDKAEIRGGQYVKERFYYTLHPFTLNSLVDFVTDSLQFNGVLTSGGIFPDITYPLSVQRDYYLGFQVNTPESGYPAYGGKGNYRSRISLDHHGLQGSGSLDYLTSTARSKDFLFLLDSAMATTDTFTVREEQGFPDIKGGRTSIHWHPYADSMAVATLAKGRPLKMYHGDATFRGRVDIMPQGTHGAGTATVKEGTLVSNRFDMLAMEMNAEVSDFTLRSVKHNNIAFTARHVHSHVDYDSRKAEFTIPEGPQRTELQLVKQEAYADRFAWDMDRKLLDIVNSTRATSEGMDAMDIRMRLQKRNDLPGVRFVSTDPKQDGLSYNALRSIYNYEQGNLSSKGVYIINVADAAIAPNADTLYVANGGKLHQLNGAQLVFNRDSAYHYVTSADVQVAGARSFTGKGFMDYRNDTEKTQRLFLDDISVDGRGVTVARGKISDSASFTISSAFGFAGKVRAEGDKRWLHFEGGVRLLQQCIPQQQMGLLAYSDYTDPEHVHIAVPEEPTDWKGKRITASIIMDKNSLRPHAAFLTNERVADNELLAAHGVLTYLGDRKQYMIGSEAKVSDPDGVVEPYLAMNTDGCSVEGEGLMDFSLKRTQASFYAYGTSSVSIGENTQEDHLTTVFGMTFPLAQNVVDAMYGNLKDDLRLQNSTGGTNAEMRHAMMYHLGADKGGGAYALYSATGKINDMPKEMRSTLLFDNIRWQYSPAVGLYYDGKVGLVSMGDKELGLELRLKAQISKQGNSQIMRYYIEAAKDHWYFFEYDLSAQQLVIYSSVGTWLDLIKAIPLEQRKIEKEGLGVFRYSVGNETTKVPNWLKWLSKTVYSSDEEDY